MGKEEKKARKRSVLQWQWERQRGGRGRSERKKKRVEKEEGFISPGGGRFSEANGSR